MILIFALDIDRRRIPAWMQQGRRFVDEDAGRGRRKKEGWKGRQRCKDEKVNEIIN